MSNTQKPKKKFNLDIFKLLNKTGLKDKNYFDSLSEQEQKGFSPLIIQRWLSGTDNPNQINRLNELLNPLVFRFGTEDKKLLYMLMTVCSAGSQRYRWLKSILSGPKSSEIISVIQKYFGYNGKEAKDALLCLTNEQIIGIANELGYQDDEIKKLKSELKKR